MMKSFEIWYCYGFVYIPLSSFNTSRTCSVQICETEFSQIKKSTCIQTLNLLEITFINNYVVFNITYNNLKYINIQLDFIDIIR